MIGVFQNRNYNNHHVVVDENKLTVEEKFLIVNTLRNLSRSFSFNRSTVDAPHVIDKRQAIVDIKVIVKKLDGVI